MTGLHLGLGPWGGDPRGPTASLENMIQQSVDAESLGFDSIWIPEGHFQAQSLFAAPLLLLAAIAARTRRIRLGTTSYLLPVRHPIRIAEDVAVLDQLSGGRVILGVGRGFRKPLFEAFEIPAREKRDRFDAVLERVLAAWRGEPIGDGPDGKPLRVTPRPLQQPHPPIWVAAFGPKALAQASRLGLPYLASPMEPLERLAENYAAHREGLPADVDPDALAVPAIRTAFITRDAARARQLRELLEDQARTSARQIGGPARRAEGASVEEWTLIGEPSEVAEQIESYRERIGLSHLIVRAQIPGASADEVQTSLEQLAALRADHFPGPARGDTPR
jgi:alkanesulfonate monooxygenase SsuD/methylene tetrahydromethanopterin reductase-like flavin-dependent oxidoreductase (luciferase family)